MRKLALKIVFIPPYIFLRSRIPDYLKRLKRKKATCAAFLKTSQRNNPYCDLLSNCKIKANKLFFEKKCDKTKNHAGSKALESKSQHTSDNILKVNFSILRVVYIPAWSKIL